MTKKEQVTKKSFILYTDIYPFIKIMPNEEVGLLFKAIYAELEGEVTPAIENETTKACYDFVINKINESNTKYQEKCERNRQNALKGWNKRNRTEEEKQQVEKDIYSNYFGADVVEKYGINRLNMIMLISTEAIPHELPYTKDELYKISSKINKDKLAEGL